VVHKATAHGRGILLLTDMNGSSFLRQTISLLAHYKTTLCLLLSLAALVVYGTVYQVLHGVYEAQQNVFNAWIIYIGDTVPVPGLLTVSALLFVNIVAAIAFRLKPKVRNPGLYLIHIGVAALLLGAGISGFLRTESALTLRAHEASHTSLTSENKLINLPVTITLDSFVIVNHSGSNAVMDYRSHVHISGKSISRSAVIAMNRPLRIGTYTFYQSSFETTENGTISIIAVVNNPFRAIPAVCGILIVIGFVLTFVTNVVLSKVKSYE